MYLSKTAHLLSTCAAASLLTFAAPTWAAESADRNTSAKDTQAGNEVQAQSPQSESDADTSSTATNEPGFDSGVIIVTANRREESLQDVGISVSVVGSQELRLQEVNQPADLARVVPGFQATSAGLTGSPVYVLRGVGFDTPNPSSTAPVGIYVNEVAYAYPYMSLGADFDLERVEVLKGPQGTLYGRNATGGLINFVTAKPTRDFSTGFTAGYGSFDSVELEAFASGPLSDTLAFRVAGQTDNRFQGWQESVTRPGDRLGERHKFAFRGMLEWEPTSGVNLLATANYWELTGQPQAPQAIAYVGNPVLENPLLTDSLVPNTDNNRLADWTPLSRQPQSGSTGIFRPPYQIDSAFRGYALNGSFDVSDTLQIATLTSYNRLTFDTVSEINGTQVESQTARSQGEIESFQQEVRLLGDVGPLSWSLGGYYAKDNTFERNSGFVDELSTIVGLRGAALGLNQLFGNPVAPGALQTSFRRYAGEGQFETEVKAAFVNLDYELGDMFSLSAGARYTEDKTSGTACGRDTDGNNVALINFLYPVLTGNAALPSIGPNECYTLNADNTAFVLSEQNQKQDNVSWRVRGDFTPEDWILLYASVSRGFKSGQFPVLAASNVSQLTPVTQEKLTAYEVGAKLDFDRRVQLNMSGYYYDYENRQIFGRIPDLIFGTLQRIVNIPKSTVWGAEADLVWRPTDSLRIQGAAAYLNAKVDEFTGFNNQVQAQQVDFAGARLPYSPEFQANASITNDMPISSDLSLLTSVYASYQTDSSSVLGNEPGFEIDGYSLVGAKIGVHDPDDSWAVEAYVTNLFDTYYWTSTQRQSETLVRYTGMPRTFGVRASLQF
ncbi:hypothetical protein WG74_06025 [Citromicrobium sp. JL477]|nr:hypothetical protein WG74_06025 [Citromicrobium sp. JL477]